MEVWNIYYLARVICCTFNVFFDEAYVTWQHSQYLLKHLKNIWNLELWKYEIFTI